MSEKFDSLDIFALKNNSMKNRHGGGMNSTMVNIDLHSLESRVDNLAR